MAVSTFAMLETGEGLVDLDSAGRRVGGERGVGGVQVGREVFAVDLVGGLPEWRTRNDRGCVGRQWARRGRSLSSSVRQIG
jgi:hypothetical protein